MTIQKNIKITPEINNLLYKDETIDIIVQGGYGGVSEYLIVTESRLIVARELRKNIFAVVFDREKDIWTELRPNDEGMDLLIFSPETMERIRNLDPTTINQVKETFNIDEGEHECFVPDEGKMYQIFKNLPGATRAEIITTRSHNFFYIIYILLFTILSFESGFHTSTMNHSSSFTGIALLFITSLGCALLVKRTFLITISSALGLLFYGYGLSKSTGSELLFPTLPAFLEITGIFISVWFTAAVLELKYRYCKNRPLLVPPITNLAITAIFTSLMVFSSIYMN